MQNHPDDGSHYFAWVCRISGNSSCLLLIARTIGIQWYISKYFPTKNLTLKYMYTAITSYHPHHYIGVHALVVCGLTLPSINLKDKSIIL